ncbi:MAG: MFS transporter [Saprospiraceae bacterium]
MDSQIDISDKPMSPYQKLMVAICFILNFNDGIDVLLVSFCGPEIIKLWGLSKSEMGYIFSAGLAGMTLGCFLIAPLADSIGRRKVFLYSIAMISFGMFGVGLINDYGYMLFFRFITGLGIGGILPTMTATAAEFSNKKYRDFNVGLVQAGWPIGAIITGLLCAHFIPIYGWQVTFFVAGCISLFMFCLVFFFLTDSLEFMLNTPNKTNLTKVNKLLGHLQLTPIKELPTAPILKDKAGVKILFSTYYKSNTIKIWIAAFFGFMTLYTLMSWVPNIAKESGMAFEMATYVGIVLNIGAAAGSASVGAFGSKYGMRQTVLTFMIVAFIVMQLYAWLIPTTLMVFILILFIGYFVQGGFNGIWPTLSRLYTSKIRTTGVGYTVGIGRLGAVLGPWLFGFLSDKGCGMQTLFIIFSLPLLIMGVAIWSLDSKELKN